MSRRIFTILFYSLIMLTGNSEEHVANTKYHLYLEALATDDGQEWVVEAWGTRLSPVGDCTTGESWIFYNDGNLIKRLCDNGQTTDRLHRWILSESNLGIIELRIDSGIHWIDILVDEVKEDGLPPQEILTIMLQEMREAADASAKVIRLQRSRK